MKKRFGNDSAGVEVWLEEDCVIGLRLWGTLNPQVIHDYEVEFSRLYKAFGGKPWGVVCDMTDCPIQPLEVSKAIKEVMARAKAANHVAGATLVSAMLTRMQIRRMAQESGIPEVTFFQDRAEAKAWLKQRMLVPA